MVSSSQFNVNEQGHLVIGGCDAVELARQFGTPLMVYDEQLIRKNCRAYREAFSAHGIKAQVAYASKAFSTIAMYQLAREEGLSLDVVSGGELYTAIRAGFPMEKVHFHGNNKTKDELLMALEAGIGCYVVDNFHELDMLGALAGEKDQQVNILLRISPGVEAHTHEYIATGQEDSKFGFDLASGQVEAALHKALAVPHFQVLGLHAHIGSQIFDTAGFELVIEKMAALLDDLEEKLDWTLSVLNVGGGFGIRYSEEDDPLSVQEYVSAICASVKNVWVNRGSSLPEIWVEPGRSIVGEAGITIYTLGASKEIPGVRHYISVDGGMSDNMRVALYQAKYEAALANNMLANPERTYTVAGKLCETGDILLREISLPEVYSGDLLVVFSTGAYGYSMANNYNRLPRPAVIFVRDGEAHVVVQRESYADLVRLDRPLTTKVHSKE